MPRGTATPRTRSPSCGLMKPRDRDGRCGCDVVRIDDLKQPLGEARELRIQFDLGAGRQEAEGLDQAFDIGSATSMPCMPRRLATLGCCRVNSPASSPM